MTQNELYVLCALLLGRYRDKEPIPSWDTLWKPALRLFEIALENGPANGPALVAPIHNQTLHRCACGTAINCHSITYAYSCVHCEGGKMFTDRRKVYLMGMVQTLDTLFYGYGIGLTTTDIEHMMRSI